LRPGQLRREAAQPGEVVATADVADAARLRYEPRGTSLWDLRDEPLVTLIHGTGLRAVLDFACAEAGFTPKIQTETDDLMVLADLVAHGLGVALIPRSTAERAPERLAMLVLRKPSLHRRTVLIWHRRQLSVPGRAFLEEVRPTTRPADRIAIRSTPVDARLAGAL